MNNTEVEEKIVVKSPRRDNNRQAKPKSQKTPRLKAKQTNPTEIRKTSERKREKGRKKGKKKQAGKVVSAYWFVAVAVISVIAIIIVPIIVSRCAKDIGVRVPEGHYSYAVDISKYQKNIVWDSLMVLTDAQGHTMRSVRSASGIYRVKYVIMKASEGETHRDALFTDHWKRSAAAGYSRGAYHFFRSSKSPEKQAMNFIHTVGNIRHKDLPPILDVETIHPGCSKAELNRRLAIWLGIIEEHYGRRPIIYTGDAFLRDRLSPEIYEHYPIWIARYSSEGGLKPPSIGNWMMWQFTDRATVYGIPSLCDLSVVAVQQ